MARNLSVLLAASMFLFVATSCESVGSVSVPQDGMASDGSESETVDSPGCVPQCFAAECGDDGCGGTCGVCPIDKSCNEVGQCISNCVPQCQDRLCGDDGCGGFCGQCPNGWLCLGATCCLPDCDSKACGDDGCGGSCGSCDAVDICANGSCCTPQCQNKDCGPDGCGSSCGTCGQNNKCSPQGLCECVPSCLGKDCGDDGCGGSCGECQTGQCNGGHCNCVPNCAGLTCGEDGCGGLCGYCWTECTCNAGMCTGSLGAFQVPCNGTVTDPATGLTWQLAKTISLKFAAAQSYCDELDLGGATDWRLPTIDELRTLVSGCPSTAPAGDCGAHDNCISASCLTAGCNGCTSGAGPNSGLYLANGLEAGNDKQYWSATQLPLAESPAFVVEFDKGRINIAVTSVSLKAVRCVRK